MYDEKTKPTGKTNEEYVTTQDSKASFSNDLFTAKLTNHCIEILSTEMCIARRRFHRKHAAVDIQQ
jgi:hypothetical protein